MKHKILQAIRPTVALAIMTFGLQGCSVLSCDNYMTYDDILDTWVGSDLSAYEQRTDNHPYSTMERPRNMMEYAFNTPYVNYDGSQQACRTWLEVDSQTGEIVGWRHEGECYMHGYCAG